MNEKEKAKELVDKFKPFAYANLFSFREESHLINCKKSALICVNEILSIKLLWYQKDTKEIDYWNDVKKEIEQL
jgi:hypothetical protein